MRAKIIVALVALALVGLGVYLWWRSKHPEYKSGIISKLCQGGAAYETGGASQKTSFTQKACDYVEKYLKSIIKAAPSIGDAVEHLPIPGLGGGKQVSSQEFTDRVQGYAASHPDAVAAACSGGFGAAAFKVGGACS